MLGLVDYDDSDEEQQEQEQPQQKAQSGSAEVQKATQQGQLAAERDALAVFQPTALGLPSAAELFGDAQPATAAPAAPMHASSLGAKRGKPDSRGPLPNPLASQPKVQRSGGAASVASGRPPPGVLVPPQVRGRANVATEDLASMFTKDSHKRLQQKAKEAQQ
jgi:hypothetical protein